MDQRETQLNSRGFVHFIINKFAELASKAVIFGSVFLHGLAACCWVVNFIIGNLEEQATRSVTLGPPAYQNHDQSEAVRGGHSGGHGSAGNDPEEDEKELCQTQDEEERPENTSPVTVVQKGPPKKTVSINENTERIIYPVKDKKKKRSVSKLPSMEREKDEEPKPLKSILKVGSDLKDKQ